MVAVLVSPSAFPHPHHCGKLSSTTPASSPYAVNSKGQGWFSCSHAFGTDSPALTLPEPALLYCPGKVQGLLSWVPQLLRGRGSSLTYHRCVCGGGGHLSLSLATTWQTRDMGPALSLSPPQGRLTRAPSSRVSSTVLPMGGVGPALLSPAAC